jgi:hypothetical protein
MLIPASALTARAQDFTIHRGLRVVLLDVNTRDSGQKKITSKFKEVQDSHIHLLEMLLPLLKSPSAMDLNRPAQLSNKEPLGGMVETQKFFPQPSKPIRDEISRVLAKHYDFTEQEPDFIINYDIKYRMSREAKRDDE